MYRKLPLLIVILRISQKEHACCLNECIFVTTLPATYLVGLKEIGKRENILLCCAVVDSVLLSSAMQFEFPITTAISTTYKVLENSDPKFVV